MNWRCGIFICRECERTVYVFPVFLDVREWERTVTAKLPPSLCRAVYGRSEVNTTAIPRIIERMERRIAPGNDKDRAASAFVCLARLCRHPLLAEETLLPEIVLEQLRELHAGIAQNIVVNVAWHGGADLIGEIQKQQGDKAEFDLHTVGLVLYLLKIYL